MDRIEQMAAFVAVAETGSFVAAARRLGRSPAGLTRAVAALEDRLGARLFTRTTRVVALTEAGRRHLEPCRAVLRDVAALESSAATESREALGSLVVTAPVVFGRLHVLPVVADFLRRHPSVEVRLVLADEVVSLVDAGIDVGVRIAHLRDSTLRAVRVGSVRRALYASPAYLAARGEPAIDAAVAGLGITRVLSYMVDHLVRAGTLRVVLPSFEPPPIPVHVVHPAGRHLPLRTRLFVDLAVAVLRRSGGLQPATRRATA